MNPTLAKSIGAVLVAGVVVSGATCWRMTRGFDLNPCDGQERLTLVQAMLTNFDYAEIRSTQGSTPLDAAGKKCATASNVAACEQAVADATSTTGWSNGSHGRMPGFVYLVVTRGDEVKVVNNDPLTVQQVLAPIDTAMKAAVVASVARGLSPSCDRSVRKTETSFEVHLETESCFGPRDEVIAVDAAGATTVLSESHGPATCVGSVELQSEGRVVRLAANY